ncbi:putative solute carrier family 40 (iron-regulated transporter) [Diplocarpon rosae]|nr:putative solute carrier family 40 (iron-regulated transporter) [Diplocarpon rosae]
MIADNTAQLRDSISQNMENTPLLTARGIECNGMSKSQAYNLYTSHFLSTWNVRTYEFAAIIFTAAAYPDTLLATGVRGIVRTLASIGFSSMVGRWVDQNPNRLKTLFGTISANRLAVIGASILWFVIVAPVSSPEVKILESDIGGVPASLILKGGLFSLILVLDIFEALSASGNMLSMERDWVVTAAAPDGQPYDLTHLNSVMRRIDLICKLVAPLLISVTVSATSKRIGVVVVGGMSAVSWAVEIFCARIVWTRNPHLQAPKILAPATPVESTESTQTLLHQRFSNRVTLGLKNYLQDFRNYLACTAMIPSLALALLHFSALSYGATFITFLLNIGFSLELITIARAFGSLVEISSTVVTPVGVQYLGKVRSYGRLSNNGISSEGDVTPLLGGNPSKGTTETGLQRLGLWGIWWQLLNLVRFLLPVIVKLRPKGIQVPVVFALWSLSPGSTTVSYLPSLVTGFLPTQTVLAITLFFFLSLSRLGLWIYDLTTQQLTQTMTLPSQRSSFTGVEYSFVSLFQLLQNVATIFLSRPEDFKWIAIMSFGATVLSSVMYAGWVWKMRGHLVHWEKLGKGCRGR